MVIYPDGDVGELMPPPVEQLPAANLPAPAPVPAPPPMINAPPPPLTPLGDSQGSTLRIPPSDAAGWTPPPASYQQPAYYRQSTYENQPAYGQDRYAPAAVVPVQYAAPVYANEPSVQGGTP